MIHGGIDGYSRVVPYLRVAPDNTALTAFGAFQEGVERYGLPSRVRSDHGENVLIAEYDKKPWKWSRKHDHRSKCT